MLSIEQVQSVYKNSPEPHLILYPDLPEYTIAGVNKAFLNQTDLYNDIIGRGMFEIFYGSIDDAAKTALEQAALQKQASSFKIKNYRCPSQIEENIQKSWNCSVYPIIGDEGEVQFIIQKFTEITAPLLPAFNDVSNILESITDCFFAVDRDWIVTYWNSEAERVSGLSRHKIVGKNLWTIYPEAIKKKFHTEYQRAMLGNISIRFEEYSSALSMWIEAATFPSENGLLVYFKDISQRKKDEALLEKERQKYRNLFNSSPLPMWVYDVKTLRFLDVNDAAINHYGYTREEFSAITLKDIRPKEDILQLTNILKSTKSEHVNKNAVRHVKKTGEIIFVNIESKAIPFEDKKARIVTAADITEKLAAEQTLEASEQRFRALIQGGSDLTSIHDKAGTYLYVSPSCKSITGIDVKFFVGKNAFDFIHEDDLENVRSQFYRLKTCKRIKIPPFRFKIRDNEFRWMETILTDMTNDPAVGGIVSNSRDITQRIKNELIVRESIERFNIVSKATSDTIWDWNIQSGQLKWNQGMKGIFKYKNPPSTLSAAIMFVHPSDRHQLFNSFQSLINSRKSRLKVEYRFRCADGTYKHVLDRAFLLFDKDGSPIRMIGAMQDITEQVNYIQEIEERNRRLEEISWIQSHIVRAPLARIMGLSKTLSDNFQDEEIMKEFLSYLDKSADELDIIIRDIISKTRTA